jgi:hypothetical protein
VLNQASVTATFAVAETGVNSAGWYYGYGWNVRPVTTGGVGYNSWHNGALDGTWTWLVRTYNGWSWAALFNQRHDVSDPTGATYSAIDSALWSAARAVTAWPTNNLFSQYYLGGPVSTAIGQLSAAQVSGPCNDLGAEVKVSVTGGLPRTSYKATGGGISSPVTFTTNTTGAGSGIVTNVSPTAGWTRGAPVMITGTGTITVTAAGKSGTVGTYLSCIDPRGE